MRPNDLLDALSIPAGAQVGRRIPKKLLVENGAPTTADKRKINEGIEEIFWLAALKPTTIGVPEFRDATREYLEIAVLRVVFRATADSARLAELVHRSVPYPVFLIAAQGDALMLSLAHKRRSQGQAGATVLDGALVVAEPTAAVTADVAAAFVSEIAVARQPRADLFALYQGWVDTVVALLAAQVTGTFTAASSPEMAAARRNALAECGVLEAHLAKLGATAAKERQVARRVELNLEIKRLQAELSTARANL